MQRGPAAVMRRSRSEGELTSCRGSKRCLLYKRRTRSLCCCRSSQCSSYSRRIPKNSYLPVSGEASSPVIEREVCGDPQPSQVRIARRGDHEDGASTSVPRCEQEEQRSDFDGCAAGDQLSQAVQRKGSHDNACITLYDLMLLEYPPTQKINSEFERRADEFDCAMEKYEGFINEDVRRSWSWPPNPGALPPDACYLPGYETYMSREVEIYAVFQDLVRYKNERHPVDPELIHQCGPNLISRNLKIPSDIEEEPDDHENDELVSDVYNQRPIVFEQGFMDVIFDPEFLPTTSNNESEIQSVAAEFGSSDRFSKIRTVFTPFNMCIRQIIQSVTSMCTHSIPNSDVSTRNDLLDEHSPTSSSPQNNFDRVVYFGNENPPWAETLLPPVGRQADQDNAYRRRSYPERTPPSAIRTRMLSGYCVYEDRMREDRAGRDVNEIVNESRCADSPTSFLCIDLCCPQGPEVNVRTPRRSFSSHVTEWVNGASRPRQALHMRRLAAARKAEPYEPPYRVNRNQPTRSARPGDALEF